MLDTDSEHEDTMETDFLPSVIPQTPSQVTNNQPFPFHMLTPYAIPFGAPVTPLSRTKTYPFIASHTMSTSARKHKTPQMKLDEVFHLLQRLSWTIADLLCFTFRVKDENGKIIRGRSEVHAKMASKFLGGFCRHSPVKIENPWGIPKKGRW